MLGSWVWGHGGSALTGVALLVVVGIVGNAVVVCIAEDIADVVPVVDIDIVRVDSRMAVVGFRRVAVSFLF